MSVTPNVTFVFPKISTHIQWKVTQANALYFYLKLAENAGGVFHDDE